MPFHKKLFKKVFVRGLKKQARRRKRAIQRGLIVAPFIPGVGGVIGRAARFAAPILTRASLVLGKGVARFAVKRPVTAFVGVPLAGGVLITSPTIVKKIITAPKTALDLGLQIGGAIEGEKPFPTIPEGFVKAGIIGAGAAGIIGAAALAPDVFSKFKGLLPFQKDKEKPKDKEKVLTQEDIQKVTPVEDVMKVTEQPTLGAIAEAPKVPGVKPLAIKNIFNPQIDIRFSKSRKFINQQILINK